MKTTPQHIALTNQPWHRPTVVVVLLLMVIAGTGNFLGTIFIVHNFISIGSAASILASAGGGLLVAQACLLAVWCALGRHNLALRLPLTMGILFALFCCYIAALNLVPNLPLELVILLAGVVITLTIFVQLPLWLLRWRTGITITRALVPNSTDSSQFSIKHLLITTTMLALLIAFAQQVVPNLELRSSPAPWWIEIIIVVAAFIVLTCLCCLALLAVVFAEKHRGIAGCGWFVTVLAGPPLAVVSVPWPMDSETVANSYCFTIALGITLVVVWSIFYLLGYRLRSVA